MVIALGVVAHVGGNFGQEFYSSLGYISGRAKEIFEELQKPKKPKIIMP